jgi:phosphinothricin acetyltransferase
MAVLSDPVDRSWPIQVRAANQADMAAVRDIYAHYVLHSLATFEETPPSLE